MSHFPCVPRKNASKHAARTKSSNSPRKLDAVGSPPPTNSSWPNVRRRSFPKACPRRIVISRIRDRCGVWKRVEPSYEFPRGAGFQPAIHRNVGRLEACLTEEIYRGPKNQYG